TRNNQTINLLEHQILNQHIREGYNYIHLGLIQVAAKPNYRLGVNSLILMILRYIRLKKFNDSIIAILESNLHDGPAFFNCYPNFSIDLRHDKTNDIVDELSSPIQIIFGIYYKVTKISYNFKALRSSKEETILVEANLRKSSIQVPKRLSHNEVTSKIPKEWLLEEITEEPKVYNTQIREMIQEGPNIRLKMNRSAFVKINEPLMNLKGQPSRHSVDGSTINLDLRGIDINNPKNCTTSVF
ncbi:hypothetical protein CR513_27087, partial [Mucuna pruriens]